jgi:hypothetical protein
MKVLANWHLPVAFALGAVLSVAGSRLIERGPSGGATPLQAIDRAPGATVVVHPMPRVLPMQRPSKGIRRVRIPPLIARPATSPWPVPRELR